MNTNEHQQDSVFGPFLLVLIRVYSWQKKFVHAPFRIALQNHGRKEVLRPWRLGEKSGPRLSARNGPREELFSRDK
jgi:hypothetical protein